MMPQLPYVQRFGAVVTLRSRHRSQKFVEQLVTQWLTLVRRVGQNIIVRNMIQT